MVAAMTEPSAQSRFDSTYITSGEICNRLQVAKSSIVHARKRGILPDPVVVSDGQFYLWERTTINPYLDAWEISLNSRRGRLRVQG